MRVSGTFSRRQAMNVGTHDLNTVVGHLLSLLERLQQAGKWADPPGQAAPAAASSPASAPGG